MYNNTNVLAAVMAYLYGSMLPALFQQQQRNATTQNSSLQQATSAYPMQYYQPYPTGYQMPPPQPSPEVVVNERVSRAAPTQEMAPTTTTEQAPPKAVETLPLDLIKHVVFNDKKHQHHKHKKTINETNKIATVELPLACPKCGAKMKLVVGLTAEGEQQHESDYCTCDVHVNRPKYVCDCSQQQQPQVCAICNKIRRYPEISCVFLRAQQTPVSYKRNAVYSVSPENYLENIYRMQQQTATEASIVKRYASYEQPLQNTNSYFYETEHEPACYCWRCRFFRRF